MEEIGSLIDRAAGSGGLAGVAAAVVRPGQPPTMQCVGDADVSTARPVDPDTVFRIASVTKTMTAIGLMQLHGAGRFQLDDPVNGYLTAFRIGERSGWPEVTFRHLLTHTAGIGEIPRLADVIHPAAFGTGKPGSASADLASLYHGVLRPEVPAGTKWAYANHGFAVAGQLLQDISGVPLPEYMREHVLDPLRMARTDYLRSDRVTEAAATGYRRRKGRLQAVRDYDLSLLGPGGVRSTLSDMARYAEALLRGGAGEEGFVLRPGTLAEMWSPQFSPDPRIPGMGLAFFRHDFDGHRVVGHAGNLPGFASALLLAPDDGVGVVVLTNTATLVGAHLLAEACLRSELGLPDPATRLPRPGVPEHPEAWHGLTGYYAPPPGLLTNVRTWPLLGGEVQVVTRNGHLLARALVPVPYLRGGARLYPVDAGDPMVFQVNAGRMVVPVVFRPAAGGHEMCVGHPVLATLRGRPGWRSSRVRLRAVAGAAAAGAAIRWARRRQSR